MESYDDICKTIKLLSSMLQGATDIDFRNNSNTNLNYFHHNLSESYYKSCKDSYGDKLSTNYLDDNCSPTTSLLDYNETFLTIGNLPNSIEADISDQEDILPDIDELSNSSFLSTISDDTLPYTTPTYQDISRIIKSESSEVDEETYAATPAICSGIKRKSSSSTGTRTHKKRKIRSNLLKPGSQLYQFILQLLDDEKKREHIEWVQRNKGIFRIINKEEVAKMWGKVKKREMTYDSLSRGLRHYYQQGLLESVNKKLHYKFTQKALDEWEVIRDLESIDERRQ